MYASTHLLIKSLKEVETYSRSQLTIAFLARKHSVFMPPSL